MHKRLSMGLAVVLISACSTVKPVNLSQVTPTNGLPNACQQRIQSLLTLSQQSPEVTKGFIRNQLCIAQQACLHQAEFNQPDWLERVIVRFIDPYTEQQHQWQQVIQHCQQRSPLNPLRDLLCQRDMARYHIFTDLRVSLTETGCSTDSDWLRLQGYITNCIDEAGYQQPLAAYIKNRVITYRNQVRSQCIRQQGLATI